jgi:hypothetical protein
MQHRAVCIAGSPALKSGVLAGNAAKMTGIQRVRQGYFLQDAHGSSSWGCARGPEIGGQSVAKQSSMPKAPATCLLQDVVFALSKSRHRSQQHY